MWVSYPDVKVIQGTTKTKRFRIFGPIHPSQVVVSPKTSCEYGFIFIGLHHFGFENTQSEERCVFSVFIKSFIVSCSSSDLRSANGRVLIFLFSDLET
jgi:hypothetical protein